MHHTDDQRKLGVRTTFHLHSNESGNLQDDIFLLFTFLTTIKFNTYVISYDNKMHHNHLPRGLYDVQ